MSFIRRKGRQNISYYPKKASTAMAAGDLVYADGSGAIQLADSTSGDHIGILMKDIAATDSDYASNTLVPVDVPDDLSEFEVDVGIGTLTTAMVGNRYDLKDENEIDVNATSKKVVTVTKFISASKAYVKINAMIQNVDVATT